MTKTVIDPKQVFGDTAASLWLGAGRAAGNATLGGLGAALEGLGGLFEPTEEQLQQQKELYRQSAEYVGLPESLRMTGYSPPEPNALTRAGRYLLDTNARVQDNIEQAREDWLGDRQGLYTKATEGIGAMLVPFLLGGTAKVLGEAVAETGDFATQTHRQGKDGGANTLKNFLANLALNAGLEAMPDGKDWLRLCKRDWSALQQVIADFMKDMLEQATVQEPVQRIIQDASQGHGDFAENMNNGLRDFHRRVYDVLTGR